VEFLQTAAASIHDPTYTPEQRRFLAATAIQDRAAGGPLAWPEEEADALISAFHNTNGTDPRAPEITDPAAADNAAKAVLDALLRASHTVAAALVRSRGQK
jgi:hypothetical protein